MILIFFFSFLLGLLFLGGINIINKSFFKLPEYKDPAEEAHKLVDVRFDESINLADWVYKFGAIQCPTKVNSTIDLVIEELNLNVAMAILDPIENVSRLLYHISLILQTKSPQPYFTFLSMYFLV